MKKDFVVYSALVGNYDLIQQPAVIDERFDYILFSDVIRDGSVGIWQIRTIPYSNSIQSKTARWVKTHPEALLSDYKASLWIDSNIIITSQFVYDRVVQLFQEGVLVSTMKHFQRNCVYDELFDILCCQYEHESVVLKWGHFLRGKKYPVHNGLCETGVFFRIHNNENISRFDSLWWQCIEQYSRRDQFSVNYALWSTHLDWAYFLPEGKSVYNSDCFTYHEHISPVTPKQLKRNRLEAWLVRYYAKCPTQRNKVKQLYFNLYGSPFPLLGALILGQYYRLHFLLFKR